MPIVRRANSADIEALTELRLALFCEANDFSDLTKLAEIRNITYTYLAKAIPEERFLSWVAEESGELVACSGLVFFERPPSLHNPTGLEGYVLNMYTLPAWRGKGLARTLLREVIACAKEREARRLWLRATDAGRPLYEQEGFVATTHDMELRW